MTAKSKTLFLTGLIALIFCNSSSSQRVFKIDLCIFDEDNAPFTFYDTIPIMVHVKVENGGGIDTSANGDLYYWFQTDSMVSAGMPPRLINTDLSLEYLPPGGKFDTIPVDLRPEEWRTGPTSPVNVWCVWAGMYIPDIIDSIPCCGNFGSAILGNEVHGNQTYFNAYPNPTNQMLFISTGQTNTISDIKIMTIEGKTVDRKVEMKSNAIDVQYLNEGIYILEIKFTDGSITRRKIQKY